MSPQPKTTAANWARPDLWKAQISELLVRWDVPCEQWQAAFGDDVRHNAGEDLYGAIITYTRDVASYHCMLTARRGELGCSISAEYAQVPPELSVTIPAGLRRGPEFSTRAGRISTVIEAAARASFVYPASSGYQPIMPLPFSLKPPGLTRWPLTDITGVRGHGETMSLAEPTPFHYSLELDGSNTLRLILEYGFDGPPTPPTVNAAVRLAKNIAEELILVPEAILPWGPPRIE